MSEDVAQLRERLKSLGYLSHGLERWFALDPWSSRTFWSELFLVSSKAAVVVAPFLAAPAVAIMATRNQPLSGTEVSLLVVIYLFTAAMITFGLMVTTAMLLKVKPSLAVNSSRFLNVLSIVLAAMGVAVAGAWWFAFEEPPRGGELLLGVALCILAFVVSVVVFSAALLSFSIHESGQIPRSRRTSRAVPLAAASAVLMVLLLVPAYSSKREVAGVPRQIVTTPSERRIIFIAVDGLTAEVLEASPDLAALTPNRIALEALPFRSPPERWASIGTGTSPVIHEVRAIEGIRLRGSERVFQDVSLLDVVLRRFSPALSLAVRQPLPPSARQRDYVWEIVSGRGIGAVAVNWWASDQRTTPTLWTIGQDVVFSSSRPATSASAAAVMIDRSALSTAANKAKEKSAQLGSAYLPALDIVLNRLELDSSSRLALSIEILRHLSDGVRSLRRAGYEVIVVGMPGEGQTGQGVLASTRPLAVSGATAYDVAPTLLDLLGFPKSSEMPGRSLMQGSKQSEVPAFGARVGSPSRTRIDQDYYESLRSLGYIQ